MSRPLGRALGAIASPIATGLSGAVPERLTGVGACMNTSFNLKGDAIVESPKDAVQTFYTSGLDYLVIGDFVVAKTGELPDDSLACGNTDSQALP